ncbi:MAG: hypothetical protein OXC01_01055 [Immundisolibacterales bacterium]|nr:hypothetical protein [Immundisolibacterales bacterium]
MIRSGLPALATAAHLLLAGTAAAQSIEAARSAQDEGRYVEAAELAEALGTSDGYALAAESLAIHGYYIAGEADRETLFLRAMGLAEEAVRTDTSSPEAHFQAAHAMGRYAQTIGPAKAIGSGYVTKIRKSLEEALALDPEMAAAHLSLATWHAEAIAGAGIVARLTYGASRKRAIAHYEEAVRLAPDETVVYVEYANGLLQLNRKKYRKRARKLLERAIATPPKDAFDRLLHERAAAKLAGLDGE